MSHRAAQLSLLGLVAALAVAAARIDFPTLAGRTFWSDGATYYSMALSLARDGDLRYEARDALRVRREFGSGPEGIFLKRSSGGLAFTPEDGFPWFRRVPADAPRVYFAKAFAYPVAAAPFVLALGQNGLLFFNVLCLGAALFIGYVELRARLPPATALLAASAVFLGSVTPLYLLWPQPEIFNLFLVTASLVAWSRRWPLLSALLLGVAAYSKPTNLLLALPLGIAPLLVSTRVALLRGMGETLRRALVVVVTTASLYGLNAAVTGELNYQGGERKTFYSRFPFEAPGVTFGNSGIWMTTDHFGPLVEGEDEDLVGRGTGAVLQVRELREAFVANLGYFWIGRYAGATLYFFPVVLAAVAFLLIGPRDPAGYMALASLVLSYLVFVWFIPANWYGGGGAVGNRYFLSLVPLALFLIPPARAAWIALGGLAVSAALVGPILADPMFHSLHPGRHGMRAPYPSFPAELTMINDLAFNVDRWRKKVPFGDQGDVGKNWPADPKAYSLYFPDDGTFGKQQLEGVDGVRLRAGQKAELILRTFEPVRSMRVRAAQGEAGDRVAVRAGVARGSIRLGPGESEELRLSPGDGLLYYASYLYVLKLESTLGSPAGPRSVSADVPGPRDPFVAIALEVETSARGRR